MNVTYFSMVCFRVASTLVQVHSLHPCAGATGHLAAVSQGYTHDIVGKPSHSNATEPAKCVIFMIEYPNILWLQAFFRKMSHVWTAYSLLAWGVSGSAMSCLCPLISLPHWRPCAIHKMTARSAISSSWCCPRLHLQVLLPWLGVKCGYQKLKSTIKHTEYITWMNTI